MFLTLNEEKNGTGTVSCRKQAMHGTAKNSKSGWFPVNPVGNRKKVKYIYTIFHAKTGGSP